MTKNRTLSRQVQLYNPSLCKKLATLDTVVDNRSDRTFEGKTTTHVHAQEESLLDIISGLF